MAFLFMSNAMLRKWEYVVVVSFGFMHAKRSLKKNVITRSTVFLENTVLLVVAYCVGIVERGKSDFSLKSIELETVEPYQRSVGARRVRNARSNLTGTTIQL